MRLFAIAGTLLFVISSPVLAWHAGGHKIVGSIAFRQLSTKGQNALVDLLKQHPRFEEEFDAKMPDDIDEDSADEWIVQQAAVFPDLARAYKGDLKNKYHHPMQHFINEPVFLTPADQTALNPKSQLNLSVTTPTSLDSDSNVIQVIRFARQVVADKKADPKTRALMLSWLIHTVGDIHQPLHSTALFSQRLFPDGDRGGNLVRTVQKRNLHSVWDDFPGGDLKFRSVQKRAIALAKDDNLAKAGKKAAKDLNEESWLEESKGMAVNLVYDDEVMAQLKRLASGHREIEEEPLDLSEEYLRTGAAAADQRVVQAGFRLGAILEGLFE